MRLKVLKSLLPLFTCTLLLPSGGRSEASQHGALAGVVVSKEEQQPLVGANILIRGTVLGTATDRNGKFVIRNIPPGAYSVVISMVGYQRQVLRDISVVAGQTTELYAVLDPIAIETEPLVVTAAKHEQSLAEVPVSVSILDAQALSLRNSRTLDEALRHVPGVNFIDNQVNVRGSTGYSRGVGTRVLLLVDGLPLLTGDTGEIIWETIPIQNIDRVEVVKGTGSALYGSSALGGVINVITKGISQEPQTTVRTYGGMYEDPKYPEWRWTNRSRFFHGIFIGHQRKLGDLGIYLSGRQMMDDGYKRNDHAKRWNGSARLSYNFSPFESAALSYNFFHQRRGNFLYWRDLHRALEPPDDQLTQRVRSTRWDLSGSFKQIVSDRLFYTTRLIWYRTRWEDNIANPMNAGGNSSRSDFLSGEVQAVYQPDLSHTLTFGLAGNRTTVNAGTIFGRRAGNGVGVYFQDDVRLSSRARMSVGGRFDLQKVRTVVAMSQFNPKLGATYAISDAGHLRFAVGRGFRAPSVAEFFTTTEAGGVTVLPNPSLRPERSWSMEVGGSHGFGSRLIAEVALFQNEFWNLIEPFLGADTIVRFQNVTRARIQGGEVGLKWNLFRRSLMGEVSYTYLHPVDIQTGEFMKYRSRHMLYASGRYALGHLTVGTDFRYLSKVDRIEEELVRLNIVPNGDQRVPIYLVDLHISADWRFMGLPLMSSFHVNNLLQYYYVELIGNIAPIRNYVFTLETRL